MKAYQLKEFRTPAEFAEVAPRPVGPGEVRVRVEAAGICASDLHLQSPDYVVGPLQKMFWKLPLTLGHEVAGEVVELGEGVRGWEVGTSIVAGAGVGCLDCWQCDHQRSLCSHRPPLFPGLGFDGGLAETVVLPQSFLVDRGNLSAELSAPLPDAGATAFRAVRHARPVLSAGETAVVIGAGGVGHFAIEIIKATTNARVVAVDVRPEGLELAARVGADATILSGPQAADEILEFAGGRCAAVVDCAGVPPSTALAQKVIAPGGEIVIVGLAGGHVKVGGADLPPGVRVRFSFGSHRSDINEVIKLAQAGLLKAEVTPFPFDELPQMYAELAAGHLVGRGVAVMPTNG